MKDTQREAAKLGGLQDHSIGGPYPWIVVGIENPGYVATRRYFINETEQQEITYTERLRGTFYYVQNPDGSIGSYLFRKAKSAHQMAEWIKQEVLPQRRFTRESWAKIELALQVWESAHGN